MHGQVQVVGDGHPFGTRTLPFLPCFFFVTIHDLYTVVYASASQAPPTGASAAPAARALYLRAAVSVLAGTSRRRLPHVDWHQAQTAIVELAVAAVGVLNANHARPCPMHNSHPCCLKDDSSSVDAPCSPPPYKGHVNHYMADFFPNYGSLRCVVPPATQLPHGESHALAKRVTAICTSSSTQSRSDYQNVPLGFVIALRYKLTSMAPTPRERHQPKLRSEMSFCSIAASGSRGGVLRAVPCTKC